MTKEEKKAGIYDLNRPTDPKNVNKNTKLDDLKLDWAEKDLPEKERTKHVHRLHPYLGKYIPQLVEIFLRKYFKKGQTVLDPFCGSGTTMVQSQEMGINSIGCDISEFNVLISKVKTQDYDLKLLKTEVLDIINKTASLVEKKYQKTLFETDDYVEFNFNPSDYLKKWFAPQALHELLVFNSLIKNYQYQDFLKITLSRSARSARLTTHFNLDFPKNPQTEPYHCYKHNRICSPTTDAFQFLKRYSLDSVKRVEQYYTLRKNVDVQIFNEDSRYFDFPLCDGVITSPPYVGLIDYHEQHRYAYELLKIEDRSENEIGPASNGKSKKAKDDFKQGIIEVINNVKKSVKKNGKIIIVAGDTDNLYSEIKDNVNLKLEYRVERHVNRRTGRRANSFFESIFIFSNS